MARGTNALADGICLPTWNENREELHVGTFRSKTGRLCIFRAAMRVASQSHHLTSVSAVDEEQFAGASIHRMEYLNFCRRELVRLETVSGANGGVMQFGSLMPFGVKWPTTAESKARCSMEREAFVEWINDLDIPTLHRRVLTVLLGLVAEAEMIDARCAGVSYSAEVGRRARCLSEIDETLQDLVDAGHLTVHSTADVFGEKRPGIIFRIRRPDVVLTVESAGSLWLADAWPRKRSA